MTQVNRLALLAVAGLVLAAAPTGSGAQQPDRPADDAARADTARADSVPTPQTARERALARLRALPSTPIQRDTTPDPDAEPVAEPAEEGGGEPGTDPGTPEAGIPLPPAAEGEDARIVVRERPSPADAPDLVMREDSVRQMLEGLAGYATTRYEGEHAVFEGETSELRLTGTSRVARDGNALETDSLLVYSGERGVVCGYGNPVLTGDRDPLRSERVCYDIERDIGMADRARTQFDQGATWYVRGPENRVYLVNRGDRAALYGERPQFTSCELEEPHYTFQAQSLKMLEGDMMVARNVTLRFDDVPVFWLPWMVQSMKPDRRSGLLMPQFGVNDIVRNSSGYNRSISNLGFFWAINDYMSTQATFEWYSNNYTAVQGNFSYRWLRQFLQGNVTMRQYWHQSEFGPGRRDMTVNTSNSWQPDERTRLQVSGDYATSTAMVRDYSFDPRELNRRIASSASARRSFGWGDATLGAKREQQITDDRIEWTLPSLNLNLRPITLFADEAGQGLTWSGSGQTSRRLRNVNEMLPGASNRDQDEVNASASHSLRLGRLSLSQNVSFRDLTLGAKPALETPADTALAETSDQALTWRTSLNFQQNLWTGTTLSPNVSIDGNQVRDRRTAGEYVAAPNRISAGASLQTSIYGFWPGFGDFSRIRHKISPTMSWAYSPQPEITPIQEEIFSLSPERLREQNALTLTFNQTFEARIAGDETAADRRGPGAEAAGETEGAAADADAAGAAGDPGDPGEPGEPGEPRRLPRGRTINLLAISTSPGLLYDFVAAREDGRGFLTDRITNSIRSDLLPGLQLSMAHELFEYGESPGEGAVRPREFSPFLTSLSTSFSIDQNFWLFRTLGLTGSGGVGDAGPEHVGPDEAAQRLDADRATGGVGSAIPRGSQGFSAPQVGVGGWRASLSYSLSRPRPTPALVDGGQQTLRGDLSFQPTEHWSVNWSTGYSFTDSEFSDHFLTLSRDMHRWQANFHFIRAQNGNFAMRFGVHLRDNPDLKVDYDQHTTAVDRRRAQDPR